MTIMVINCSLYNPCCLCTPELSPIYLSIPYKLFSQKKKRVIKDQLSSEFGNDMQSPKIDSTIFIVFLAGPKKCCQEKSSFFYIENRYI